MVFADTTIRYGSKTLSLFIGIKTGTQKGASCGKKERCIVMFVIYGREIRVERPK